jgi:hypothetical protein
MSMLEKIANGFKGTLVAGALAATAACGGGNGGGPGPVGPTGPQTVTIQVYNATEGYKGDMSKTTDASGQITITSQDIANVGAGRFYPEITVRTPPTQSALLGTRVVAGQVNADAKFKPDSNIPVYRAYVPNMRGDGEISAEYNCQPEPDLKFGRNVIIGEKHENNATGPLSIFTDTIANITQELESRNYGKLTFQSNTQPNPQATAFTIGFTLTNRGAAGYFLPDQRVIYMLGREYIEPNGYRLDFDSAETKDIALEEVFETLTLPAGTNNYCGAATRIKIGLHKITNNKQSGLSPAGIDFLNRAYTRASQ